ncbi:MAG: hypothetical protein HKM96_16060 [Boseongicola sp.]|nr:hypothetical protein [Boseongicola sp.]
MKVPGTLSLLTTVMILPTLAAAGGYGSAGVKDATVGPSATATATVWCPALETEIPVALQADMNCGEAVAVGSAKPKVARERFGPGPFGLPPHERIGPTPKDDDNDQPPLTTVSKDPAPDNNPVDKWGRLGQLGVNQSNYHQQGQGFIDKVDAFRNQAGTSGDWSNFQP